MTATLNAARRWAIRKLIGQMEACTNVTIANGEVECSGRRGGAIVENNRFVERNADPAAVSSSEDRLSCCA